MSFGIDTNSLIGVFIDLFAELHTTCGNDNYKKHKHMSLTKVVATERLLASDVAEGTGFGALLKILIL